MQKLDYTFKGFALTHLPNNKNHLVLIVANDMRASIVYATLASSINVIPKYLISNEHFDLFLYMNDINKFIEHNDHTDEKTKELAYAIDNNSITDLWIGYYQGEKLVTYGTAIRLFHQQ